jgi:two-component system OmpR family response regulator
MTNATARVLIVDDARDIREPLVTYLRGNGLDPHAVDSVAAATSYMSRKPVDLIVLDIMLPGEDGLSFCRRLRAEAPTPVILLSARSDEVDRIVGLEVGADDYLAKPFNPRELLARIQAVLRRVRELPPGERPPSSRVYHFGRWKLSAASRTLVDETERVVTLSGKEFRLLTTFLDSPQTVFSREQLLLRVHGRGAEEVLDRSIDTQVSRLRRKLGDDPDGQPLLQTAWGSGYVLAAEVERQ